MAARSLIVTTLVLGLAAFGTSPSPLAAQTVQDPADPGNAPPDLDAGESPERYAEVKVVEGAVTIHKGEADETLTRGIPVAEGDVVESHGRGILQLGDGSVLAFGDDTHFRIAALFSQQDQDRRVLITLDRGELRLHKGTYSDATLRVDTPSGSGTLGNRGNAPTRPDVTFQVMPDRTVLLVHGGQIGFTNDRSQTQIFAGQRLTIYGAGDGLNRVGDFNAFGLDAFDQWNDDLVTPHPSESASHVPEEIRYYADDLDSNGTWTYVDDCQSWCWTPTAVAVDWRPYAYGRWGCYGGGMTWVSTEPWGYVTYHHGRWGWGPRIGWYWIPGIYYSPAWVAWNCCDGYFGWAPLGYWNRPCVWGYGPWGGGPCWNVVSVNYVGYHDLRTHYYANPAVFHSFNAPPAGGRPWFANRVMVTRAEFGNPATFQRVVTQPGLVGQRIAAFDRTVRAATGRSIVQPPAPPTRAPMPFRQMERPASQASAPIFRPADTGPRRSYAEPGSSSASASPYRNSSPGAQQGGTPRPFVGSTPGENGGRRNEGRDTPRSPEAGATEGNQATPDHRTGTEERPARTEGRQEPRKGSGESESKSEPKGRDHK
jgi:hypothetical protein